MSSKANGKTYKKANGKYGKQQDLDTQKSQKSAPLGSFLSDDYSLIAVEVARLINPVIEPTIGKAIDKLQNKISNISKKLSIYDKRFGEIEDAVSQIQDETIDSLSRIDILEKQTQELKLKLDDLDPLKTRVFSNPSEALKITSHLEKKNAGNLVSDTTSYSNFSSPPMNQRDMEEI
ncbi:hypothetical protein XELAEV_18038475mg [Xenopus laevis]|uniref:Uncharacterized protein n=1 Tax=Xenopus laevis TaxID=8355 RepID=A0A974C648_XENLA|nr:hypothetical protein XELAEV_18038475mg [Xenopus laevis]